jgi:hypothetical protein
VLKSNDAARIGDCGVGGMRFVLVSDEWTSDGW